jgi:hypothetical protein
MVQTNEVILTIKQYIFFLSLSFIITGCSQLGKTNLSSAHDSTSLYGCPWNSDGLANLEIGKQPGRTVGYRFRAETTAMVDSVCLYLIFRAPGYFKGDGGQVLLELMSDDGSPEHFPSGKVLTSSPLVKDPMKKGAFRMFPFVPQVKLEKGKFYHLTLSNPSQDPVNNFVSIDDLLNPKKAEIQRQPGISDTDLAVVWKDNRSSSWEVNPRHTPIYCLYYNNGVRQGQGYYNARSQSCLRPISREKKVRESFTVSGKDRTVKSLFIRLYKKGNPGNLKIRLEYSDGSPVKGIEIPSTAVRTDISWISYPFDSPLTLHSGKSYNLVLSAEPGDSYFTFPLSEGGQSGFRSPNLFTDGDFQYTDGGGWQENKADDMQFYLK